VARKFHAGEYERAVLECDRVSDQFPLDLDIRGRANELKKLIPSFASSFDDAQQKYRINALQSAVRPLQRAKDLYEQIGFPGALGTRIDEDLASASLASADSAMAKEDLAEAAAHYRDALRLVPSDTRAKEGMERLSRRAEQLFLEASVLQDRDLPVAVTKLKLVMAITPSASPIHKKAKNQLTLLEP
jgi:hypothetical protein